MLYLMIHYCDLDGPAVELLFLSADTYLHWM